MAGDKKQLSEGAAGVFGKNTVTESPVDLKVLHAKIGQLTLENDFLEGALTKVGLLTAVMPYLSVTKLNWSALVGAVFIINLNQSILQTEHLLIHLGVITTIKGFQQVFSML